MSYYDICNLLIRQNKKNSFKDKYINYGKGIILNKFNLFCM